MTNLSARSVTKSNPRISHPREGEIEYPPVLQRWAPKPFFPTKPKIITDKQRRQNLAKKFMEDMAVNSTNVLKQYLQNQREAPTPGIYFNSNSPNGKRRGR